MFIKLKKRRKVFNVKTDIERDLILFTLTKESKKIYFTPVKDRKVKLRLPNWDIVNSKSLFTSEVWENKIEFENIIWCISVENIIEIF